MKNQFLAIMIAIFVLSACNLINPTPVDELYSVTDEKTSSNQPVTLLSPTHSNNTDAPDEIPTVSSISLTSTPTPPRPMPDWQDVPIMPVVGEHVLQIYLDGQAKGRDPHNFSVIGDCQSIPYVFMGPFGRGVLVPDPAEDYLWNALNYFEASFDRWSLTSRGGFTAASILTSIQADPHYCKPGETPLTCEYRLNNPAYVFITLETWLDPETIDRYEDYLRSILDYVLEQGSIPILMTKADAAEVADGHHVINPAIVRVAYDYDVPVINFWRAAQYLDNVGIDPARDGFHLSQEGYDVKNILALRALYAIWQVVEGQGDLGTQTAGEMTSTPTLENNSNPAVLTSSPDCSGGCIFFGMARSRDGVVNPDGVYAYNPNTKVLASILGPGFDLQDASTDGRRLLVNRLNSLYEIDLDTNLATLISDSFNYLGKQGAYWTSDDSTIVFLDMDQPLQSETGEAYTIFPSSRDNEIYFDTGTCSTKDYCQSNGVSRLNPDQTILNMEGYSHLAFSPNGQLMAYLDPAVAINENYYHIGFLQIEEPDRGLASRRIIYFPQEHGFMVYPDVREYIFSPDNEKLIILYDVYSAYFERSLRFNSYMLDFSNGILYEMGKMEGISGSLNPRMVWSPDAKKILFFLTDINPDEQFNINIYLTDLASGEKLILFHQNLAQSDEYIYITNLFWR